MKRYFPYILTFAVFCFFAAQVLGSALSGTNVSAPIKPFDSADTYPTHDARYGKGGYVQQPTTTARNAIPAFRRMTGMYVYVTDQDKEYQLYNGTSNADWRERPGGSGHGIKNNSGNTMPTRTYLRYSSPFQVTDNAGADETRMSIAFANQTTGGLKSASDKKKSNNFLDAKADFGCKGDDSTDDTACIFTAISTARTVNKPLKFRNGRFKTNGGYLLDWPVDIQGENATFVLTSDAILFDVSPQQGLFMKGFDVEVPDANTSAVIRFSTSGTRTTGRGWGPIRNSKFSDMRIYSASSRYWSPATGIYPGIVNTKGSWIGIELWADTTLSRTGINYAEFENIHIEFPYYGIKLTKAGSTPSNNAWAAGLYFKAIFIHGFKYGIYGRTVNFNANTINQLMLQPLRDDGSIGLDLDNWCTSNSINLNVFHDGGWNGQTRGNFQTWVLGGVGNIITGYAEVSEETPSESVYGNTFLIEVNQTNTAEWNGGSPAVNTFYQHSEIRGPLGINTFADSNSALHIVKEYDSPSTSNVAFLAESFGDQTRFKFRSANGTRDVPTKKLAGENYAIFGGSGYSGAAFPDFSPADVRFYAEENQDTGWGSGIKFFTTPSGNPGLTSGTQAVRINSAGRVIIDSSNTADDGANRLQVNGNVKAAEFIGGGGQLTGIFPTLESGKYLTNSGSTLSWATVAAGLELSRVVTGGQTAQSTDSLVEFTATGSYAIPASLANKKSIVVSNTSAADTVSITAGASVILVGGTYSLLAQTFCVLGEDPDNIDTWRVVAVGSNGAAPDLSGYALLAGRATPQQLNLGTASGAATGYFSSTAHATKGKYFLNAAGTMTVDEVNTWMGIGTATPASIFHTVGSGAGSQWTLRNTAAASASTSSVLALQQDDSATPQATPSGSRLGLIVFGGDRDASHSISHGGAISAFAEETWTSTSIPTYLTFNTAPSGSTTRAERLRINSAGLTYFSNGAGLPSGNMYSNTSTTITVASSGTWYEVDTGATDFTAGQLTGVTFSDHYLVAPVAGKYMINATVSFGTSTASDEIAVSVAVNGTSSATCHGHATVVNATTTVPSSCTTILSLAANDQVSLAVQNHTAARNITLSHANVSMLHVAAQ